MRKITVLLFVVLTAVAVFASDDDNNNNVRTTRTSIKVARNVDPDAMETLEVKTRTGDVATIVVKKREGRQRFAAEHPEVPDFRLVSSSSSSSDGNSGSGRAVVAVPDPVVVRSDSVYVKGTRNGGSEENARSRSLVHVDADGIPVITGVREPDDENDAVQVWRNARVIDGVLVPNQPVNGTNQRQQQQQQQQEMKHEVSPMFNGVWQVYRKKPAIEPPQKVDGSDEDDGDAWKKPALVEDPDERRYMTDKILGYIKNINGDVLRAGDRASRAYDTRTMQARVLHAPGVSVFPNSAAYSPPAVKASRLSFEQSARTPVLQYAHPELGVQTAAEYEAAALMPPSRPEEALQAQRDGRRQQALSYFGHDIHADRSPFAFEPGLEKESRVKIPKKYSPPSSPHYGVYQPDKPGRYAVPAGGYYADDETTLSFWTMMKNKMKTSVDKMSDWTKPVVDPLVEATHKITGNLGFGHGNRELTNVVKEKLGMVATPSVLLPALGLVAGGAALGLGAVAVGRYLDYDVVRMRNNGDIVEFQRSLNGSYVPIIIQPEPQENKNIETETEIEKAKETGPLKRNKRSIYYKKSRPYTNRKIRKVKLTVKTS